MAKKAKVKGPESVGFKEIFGVTTLATNNGFAAIFMSTMFMTYMTDYAGLGAWGATLATTLLLAARIIDAVDDPIQGFIMDRGKVGKHGKYKPFFLLSIIMTTIGVITLYSLPDGIVTSYIREIASFSSGLFSSTLCTISVRPSITRTCCTVP